MEFNYEHDSQNFRKQLLDFPIQFKDALTLGSTIKIDSVIEQIVVIGMGGSGVAGRFLQNYLSRIAPKIPVHVIGDYQVPPHATKNALVFVLSYSGNTEETLAAYRLIARSGSPCVVISSGGKLSQIAPMFKSEFIEIPNTALMPRMATPYLLIPMLIVLMKNGVIPNTAYAMDSVSDSLGKDIYESYAKDLVEQVGVKTPIIYTGSDQSALGYKWKTSLNETAKTFAFSSTFPECLHNELECFSGLSESLNDFVALLLKDVKSDGRIQKQMDAYKATIRKKGGSVLEVVIRSADPLSYLFTTLYLGEWFAYYMALAKGVNPSNIDAIEDFKKRS